MSTDPFQHVYQELIRRHERIGKIYAGTIQDLCLILRDVLKALPDELRREDHIIRACSILEKMIREIETLRQLL